MVDRRFVYLGEYALVMISPMKHPVVWRNCLNAYEWNPAGIILHGRHHLLDQG